MPHRQLPARPVVLALTALAVLAALLASPADPAARADATEARQIQVRVATYNIHHGAGADGDFDLARTAAAIRATGADVVGLQEVDVHWGWRSDWRDEAAELAEMLDMNVFFGHIYSLDPPAPERPRREYGLAILSRYPIVHAENHEITRLSTQSPDAEPAPAPGFPEVVVNVRGALVHVYDTHLDYRSDPTVRRMQVEDMLAIMAEDARECSPATTRAAATAPGTCPPPQQVLLGDFNAPPGAPELAPLWDRLTDTWQAGGGAPNGGLTYPATDPVKRIDYITVSDGIQVRSARVPHTPASDHLPVVADVTVARGM